MNANDRLRCAELSRRLKRWMIGGAVAGLVIWGTNAYILKTLVQIAWAYAAAVSWVIPLSALILMGVVMNLWLVYWVRLAIDARLFEQLADGTIADLPALDAHLAARGWKKAVPGAPLRNLSDRIQGTERLIKGLCLSLFAATLTLVLLVA
jgi:hypothetical protein